MNDLNPQQKLARIIFGTDTHAGRLYDIGLIIAILLSVTVAMLDSIQDIHNQYEHLLVVIEWGLTILFTIDYVTRLICANAPTRYARSFFGIIDLLSVIPTYLSILFPGARHLTTIRFLRVLRIFRVLKLTSYQTELQRLNQALSQSLRRITAFLLFVFTVVVILGALMYTIEPNTEGFTSIPRSIYWAIVTLTTVGYGDISPQTGLGQALAALIMILGYSIIVIPTGIVAATVPQISDPSQQRPCPHCQHPTHDRDATFCKRCGQALSSRKG